MGDKGNGARTIGELYRPAMVIKTRKAAEVYFKELVEYAMSFGQSREEAVRIQKSNLGYFAGYYDHETRKRVERLFCCEHPVFGSIEKNGAPTQEQAFAAGRAMGKEAGR